MNLRSSHPTRTVFPDLARVIRQFWPQIYQEKHLIMISVIGLVIEVLARLPSPWPLKLIFDYLEIL